MAESSHEIHHPIEQAEVRRPWVREAVSRVLAARALQRTNEVEPNEAIVLAYD